MTFPDIFEQTVLTEVIRREWEDLAKAPGGGIDTSFRVENILRKKPMNGRRVKIRVQDILPYGMAPFRAPHASPALWTPRPRLREEVIEIVDIDEVSRVDEVKMLALKSRDPNLYDDGVVDLVELATGLQRRNELRSEWMGWQALQGILPITYPDSGTITINYGIPSGHFPVFGIPWTDLPNADPIENLWSLGAVAVADAGIYLPWHHMSDATFRQMRKTRAVRDALSSYGRSVMQATMADIRSLMRDDSDIRIVDGGYLPENATNKLLTKWIPDGKIMSTPRNYQYAGRPIGDIADGYVLVKPQGAPEPIARQGMQSEIKTTEIPPYQTFLRQVSSRMPRMYAPEAIAWGTAYRS